ncbi:MAG: M4 family metallopeptidase [Chloroflexota bacterium]
MPKSFRRLVLYGIFIALFSISFVQPSFASPPAQEGDAGVRVVTDSETGLYKFVGIDSQTRGSPLPGAAALQQGTPTAATALADLTTYGKEFGLSNPGQDLQFMKASGSPGESQSFRYQQVYQGVPVIAGELIANYDGKGRLAAVTGEASPKLALSTVPSVTADRAAAIAIGYVAKAENLSASDLAASAPILSIFDPHLFTPENDAPSLVWRLEVRPAADLRPIRYMILVDAAFGGVSLAFNQVDTSWHSAHPSQTQVTHPAVAQAALPILDAPQFAPHFANPTGATYDSQGDYGLRGGYGHSIKSKLICNTPPTDLHNAGSCGNFASVTPAGAAHYFAYNTFNYYDSHHNRNSIDGKGLPLISNVNYCEPDPANGVFCPGGFQNAFWDGIEMVYGDDGWWTADDVIGHELTHGVTEHESGLFYFYESGAINESMSDIFGEFVDQWNGINSLGGVDLAGDKWALAEDLTIGTLRDMSNPPAFGQPDRTQSTSYYQGLSDNGGVHENSGVGNKAAYLMAQGGSFNGHTVTALGNDKTGAIFYEVNSNLLTSGSDYGVLGAAIAQACTNVLTGANTVGMTPADCAAAREAVLATEMQIDPVAAVNFRPQAEVCPNGSRVTTSLLNANFEGGLTGFTSGVITGAGYMPPSKAWVETSTVPGLGTYAVSGTHSAFGVNAPGAYGYPYTGLGYESYFQTAAAVALPAGSTFYLHFKHSLAVETNASFNYDGAVVEYSMDGGPWSDAGPLYEAGQNYNGTIYTGYGNPLSGRQGFVQRTHGYVSSRYNLSSLAGHSIRFRWVIGADDSGAYYGWFLDDIQIYNCDILRNYTTDTTPTLTWTGTLWATTYDVAIATNSTFTNPSVNIYITGSNATTFTLPVDLLPGTYYWRVRANNGATLGTWGPSDSFTIGS